MSDPARVLIVDDEPNVRLVFRVALESAGYGPSEVADGPSALEALARSRVDLVLLDLRMPGMDGLETLRRLRDRGDDVPVVIVTAYGSVPDAVRAMKLGAIDFLAKPLDPGSLREVVAEVLRRHASGRPGATRGPRAPEPDPARSQFADHLTRAKRAINYRWFPEAEASLRQAIGLDGRSAEAHNLMGVLHELRDEHDASYLSYKAALKADRHHEPAQRNMRRYYERFTFGSSTVPVDSGEP